MENVIEIQFKQNDGTYGQTYKVPHNEQQLMNVAKYIETLPSDTINSASGKPIFDKTQTKQNISELIHEYVIEALFGVDVDKLYSYSSSIHNDDPIYKMNGKEEIWHGELTNVLDVNGSYSKAIDYLYNTIQNKEQTNEGMFTSINEFKLHLARKK